MTGHVVLAASLAGVFARFDLASPDTSPFPSDRFTVEDARQRTGLRVNLPLPDCAARPSDCEDVRVLNQLDGFNMRVRLSIPFSGPIDVGSVGEQSVFLLRLDGRGGAKIALNQMLWDRPTHTLHALADEMLAERTRYALVVTRRVRDSAGLPIAASPAFRNHRKSVPARYRRALLEALESARRAGVGEPDIAVASVFTTQTFSHLVGRMRDEVLRARLPRLSFEVGTDGRRAVFDAAQIRSLTNNAETQAGGPLTSVSLEQLLGHMRVIPGAVGTLAFGRFRAPDFTTRPSGHIAPFPTRTGRPAVAGSLDVAFDLWLPAGSPPARGWPIVIYGHGSFGHKNTPFSHAAVLASHGLAVIGTNAIGRGHGPRTTMSVERSDGTTTSFAAPGLGYDADGDGAIGEYEPRRARRPYALLNVSGPIAQAAAQDFALVRALQAGVDVDGDGAIDLDASRIYFLGQSMGAMWGMLSFVQEPAIRAAVFAVPTGTLLYDAALSAAPAMRSGLGELFDARTPSLLNSPHGVTSVDGIAVGPPHFDERLPLRGRPVLVSDVPGAMEIQRVMDRIVWAAQAGSTVAVAPLLRLTGRPFVLQFARSDQITVNPSAAELIRAGDFADRVLFYRHDRNFGNPGVPPNPHGFLSAVRAAPNYARIALGAQHQIGAFFESDGARVVVPEPPELWEWPIRLPLPEDTFFLPRPR